MSLDDRTAPLVEDQTNRRWQFNGSLDLDKVLTFLLPLSLPIYHIPNWALMGVISLLLVGCNSWIHVSKLSPPPPTPSQY